MKAEPPPLRVGTPCPKNWDDMEGDAKRRFCEHCQLHVHNLSAMKPAERTQFVAETRDRACITYELRADGTMVTRSRWNWVLRPLRAFAALLAAMLPFAFASCAPTCSTRRLAGSPMPPPDASHSTKTEPGSRTLGIVAQPQTPPQTAPKRLGKMAILGESMPAKSPPKPE